MSLIEVEFQIPSENSYWKGACTFYYMKLMRYVLNYLNPVFFFFYNSIIQGKLFKCRPPAF